MERILAAIRPTKGGRMSYQDQETAFDGFMVCDDCYEQGGCLAHGPTQLVQDNKVRDTCPRRAWETLPNMLNIWSSLIHNYGVFAREKIKARTRFGPYQGKRTSEKKLGDLSYVFRIEKDNNNVTYVDAKDESVSNWMRFVNCNRNRQEQNLQAFQYRNEIYYWTCRDIEPGEELLVWYGELYAQKLGISVKQPENGRKRKRDEFSSSDESRREESKSARSVGARDDDMDADVIVLGDESTDSDPFDSLRALFGGVQVNSTAEKGAEIVELAQADAAANDTDQSPVVSLENDDSLNAPGRDARSPLHFGECDSTVRLGHEVELSFDSSRADNDEAVHDVENVGTDGNQGTERNGYPQEDKQPEQEAVTNCDRVHISIKTELGIAKAKLVRKQEKRRLKNLEIDEEIANLQKKMELKNKTLQDLEFDLEIKLLEKQLVEQYDCLKAIKSAIDEKCKQQKRLRDEIRVIEEQLSTIRRADTSPNVQLFESEIADICTILTQEEKHMKYKLRLNSEVPAIRKRLEKINLENKQLERELEVKKLEKEVGALYEKRNAIGLEILEVEKKRREVLGQANKEWDTCKDPGKCQLALSLFG